MSSGGEDDLKIVIHGKNTITGSTEPSGCEGLVMKVPDAFYVDVGGGTAALNMPVVGPVLRRLSNKCAADLGHQLHHADWQFTVDPEMVRRVAIMHDCVRCRAGCDQALAELAAHPDEDLLVATLYWV